MTKVTHWWAEVYVDGRWVIIDANAGTNSRWTRTSFTDAGNWTLPGTSTYAGFDPSKESLSNSYIYLTIYQGSNSPKFIAYVDEFNKLKSFFNKNYSGVTNGKKLNSKYNQNDPSTWASSSTLKTDGFGKVSYINWNNKSLRGTLNLSDLKSLKYLSIGKNKITSLNITNCTALTNVQAYSTSITKFNSLTAPNIETINLNSTKLYSASFKDGKKKIIIKRNIAKGSFSFKYNKSNKKRVTINVGNAYKGYKYLGIYRNGKKLTSKKTYSFNPPSSSTYYVKFKKR